MLLNRPWKIVVLGSLLGAAYALVTRFVFGLDLFRSDGHPVFGVMSAAFIFVMPFALGFLSMMFVEPGLPGGVLGVVTRWIFVPWGASVAFLVGCLIFRLEGLICVVLLLPVLLVLSTLGGLLAALVRPGLLKTDRSRRYAMAFVALLPFLAGPLESLRTVETEVRTVPTSIEIAADPATVWREIRSVPRITEAEQAVTLSHRLGFPRPVEAVLEGTGVGAVRYARFERGVLFIEKVTEWEENRRLSFSIAADTKSIPPTTFDEHVTIGGPYFDVLHGSYWIEPVAPGRVVLHLSSDQRLSTGFNFYSRWWTEMLMADLQNDILRIIKARCERPAA